MITPSPTWIVTQPGSRPRRAVTTPRYEGRLYAAHGTSPTSRNPWLPTLSVSLPAVDWYRCPADPGVGCVGAGDDKPPCGHRASHARGLAARLLPMAPGRAISPIHPSCRHRRSSVWKGLISPRWSAMKKSAVGVWHHTAAASKRWLECNGRGVTRATP